MSKDDYRPKARRPRGFQDRRGQSLTRERAIVEQVLKVYEAWGFERLETSAFEYAEALGKFLPDQDRPNEGVFATQDDDEQWMALRYDLTAPLARFVAENFDALPKPYRRCAAGPVWRNEKPGPGRFREFWQCDADTVGSASPASDAEMIAMACAALEAVGVERGKYVLKFSSRALLDGLMESMGLLSDERKAERLIVMRAIDKLDRLGKVGVRQLLMQGREDDSGDFTKGAGLKAEEADAILLFLDWNTMQVWTSASEGTQDSYSGPPLPHPITGFLGYADNAFRLKQCADLLGQLPKGQEAIENVASILSSLKALGIDSERVWFDPTIVRGLEYYTGAVFEAELLIDIKDEDGKSVRFGSVGGGGRYDDLVARFRGERVPATGFSIGVSRLAAALTLADQAIPPGPVVILAFDPALMGEYFQMAQTLRAAGIAAEVYLGGSGPKAQFKYADKRNAPAVVIMGGDEKAKGEVAIKDLRAGAALAAKTGDDRSAYQAARGDVQVTVPQAQWVQAVKDILARSDS
jgi:histidyl-tRNA synthetase